VNRPAHERVNHRQVVVVGGKDAVELALANAAPVCRPNGAVRYTFSGTGVLVLLVRG